MRWTIAKRLKAGDEFMCCWHLCRVNRIIEEHPEYNSAEVDCLRAVKGAHKGPNNTDLPIPPMIYGGKAVSDGWSPHR